MGAEEGLSSGDVYCIHQDKYGFIWIGTQTGLNLYDGYDVKVFNADLKDPHSLPHGFIFSMFEEVDGTMWFCTDIGISKYNRANQTFSNYFPDTLDLESEQNAVDRVLQDGNFLWVDAWENNLYRFNKKTRVFQSFARDTLHQEKGIYYASAEYIFIDGSGTLWVCSGDGGGNFALSKFNNQTETFTHFQNDPSDPESFAGKRVKSMTEDRDGTIWVATFGGGLLEVIDMDKGKFMHYIHDKNDQYSIIHNYLQKLFTDSRGNVWIGAPKGFSKVNKDTGRFINYHIPNRADFANRANVIYDINEGVNGELFLSSRGGLFRFNPSINKLSHYLYDPDIPDGISDNLIYQVITDQTDQTWIAVPNRSLHRINQFSNTFIRIKKKPNVKHSLSDNFISDYLTDSRGNFWVGTFGGGLNRTKLNNHSDYENFEHFIYNENDSKSISGKRITTIYEDRDQTLWFGTFWGLNSYDYKTNSFTRYQHDSDDDKTISSNMIMSIYEDSHGIFWVGTRNGLNIMDKETGKFIHFLPDDNDSSSISGKDIRLIFEDSYGDLWFGGTHLEKLNRKDTSFIRYFSDSVNLGDFENLVFFNISEDDSANLWMSTMWGGIIKLQRNDMTFVSITTDQGLPSNYIMAIEVDNSGFIWASTSQGLVRIDPNDYSIRKFDMADGLINLEFQNRSSYKDKDGWLYFGSKNGFNVFHPDSIKENKVIPPVYITSLNVGGEPKYFAKPLYELEDIELQYNENDFSFDFVALNYINTQKNQYAYMLEGYDEDWKYVGNKRSANYTNMSPGEYTFRVNASNNDGYWNEEGASLNVIIHPPFWKTWWAYAIYTFVFLCLVYMVRRNELRKINLRQELELEQQNAENLAELDIEKNKFFSNISHEFRTPLTLILGPLERIIMGKNEGQEKDQLNLIGRNARRLQTLINQLLSLSKIESGKMKLKARPENIVKLTSLFVQSFHSMAENKGIKLEFESDADEHIVYIDTIKFEKVVNNLLSNAFKFTDKGGEIKISVCSGQGAVGSMQLAKSIKEVSSEIANCKLPTANSDGQCVEIKVSDTGIGINKEELPHVFDRFYQVDETQMKTNLGTGIGLSLTKELIELHHGTIEVESEPGKGTTFTVSLPMGKEHLSEEEIFNTGKNSSEEEEDLLNDDYLFVQDAINKPEIKTEILEKKDLPLLLIVEDNEDMRTYIKSYLVDSFNIIEAENGKEGAVKAIEHIPDLVVSDLMMPKLDGNEMTIQLKTDERTSHIPIILLTAKASRESKLEGLETGADDFLTKPFDAEELLVRIKNLIDQRKKLSLLLSDHIGNNSQTRLIQKSSGKMITSIDELFIEKISAFVQEHLSNPELKTEMLAREMAMSRMQLHRKLKSLTDNSPGDLIRNIRLTKAADLLKAGELNVTQISYEIGISSLSNFAKIFKEKYGVTPSEYS